MPSTESQNLMLISKSQNGRGVDNVGPISIGDLSSSKLDDFYLSFSRKPVTDPDKTSGIAAKTTESGLIDNSV